MANEKENLTIGQALDIIVRNAEKRIGDLEVIAVDKENRLKALEDRVARIAAYLNKEKGLEFKQREKTQDDFPSGKIEEVDDTAFLAAQTKSETKAKPLALDDKRALISKIEDTEETGVDWTIRIKGQCGSSLVLAKYEHEELYNVIANPNFTLPHKDNKWTIEQLENGLIKIDKIGKDGKHYFGLV